MGEGMRAQRKLMDWHPATSAAPASPGSRSGAALGLLAVLVFPDGDLLSVPHMPSCSSALPWFSLCASPSPSLHSFSLSYTGLDAITIFHL